MIEARWRSSLIGFSLHLLSKMNGKCTQGCHWGTSFSRTSQRDVPQNLEQEFFLFLENTRKFTHELTAEVRSSLRLKTLAFDFARRGTNNVAKNEALIWTWREGCLNCPSSKRTHVLAPYIFRIFSTPLLYKFETDRSEKIHVDGFFFLVRAMGEPKQGTLCTTCENAQVKFIM